MTNDTNITNDKDINANISHDDHFNDSIVNEVILEDMKKNRIDHMKYLPDMEVLDSDIMDRVVAEMDAYDYDQYTAADEVVIVGDICIDIFVICYICIVSHYLFPSKAKCHL